MGAVLRIRPEEQGGCGKRGKREWVRATEKLVRTGETPEGRVGE
jgi:hypothetical protein